MKKLIFFSVIGLTVLLTSSAYAQLGGGELEKPGFGGTSEVFTATEVPVNGPANIVLRFAGMDGANTLKGQLYVGYDNDAEATPTIMVDVPLEHNTCIVSGLTCDNKFAGRSSGSKGPRFAMGSGLERKTNQGVGIRFAMTQFPFGDPNI